MEKNTKHLDLIEQILIYIVVCLGIASIFFVLAPIYHNLLQLICFFGYNFNLTLSVFITCILWYFNIGFGKGRFALSTNLNKLDRKLRIKISLFLICVIIALFLFGDFIKLSNSATC